MGVDQLTRVRAVALFTNQGTRIASQYYDNSISESSRSTFETTLFAKISEEPLMEICQFNEYIAVFRAVQDLFLIIVGAHSTNELLFGELIDTIETAMGLVFRKMTVDGVKAQIEDFYLILDESIHEGFVFEPNGEIVAARVQLKDDNALSGASKTTTSRF
jgi:hypothetical protein